MANAPSEVRLVYHDGKGILRRALEECARLGFSISDLTIRNEGNRAPAGGQRLVEVDIELWGKRPISDLAADLEQIDGVIDVGLSDRQTVAV